MTQSVINWITMLSDKISLELFSFIGPFIEETFAPIPSPLVMGTVGSMAQIQQKPFYYLIVLSIIAGIAKTLGSLIIYFVADKAENFMTSKFAKILGLNGFDMESVGKYFDNTKKDDLIIIFLRAFPLIPGTPVSLFCGFIKVNLFTFTYTTFIGTFLRSFFFAWLGYSGVSNYQQILDGLDKGESVVNIVGLVLVVVFLGYLYKLRKEGKLDKLIKKFIN